MTTNHSVLRRTVLLLLSVLLIATPLSACNRNKNPSSSGGTTTGTTSADDTEPFYPTLDDPETTGTTGEGTSESPGGGQNPTKRPGTTSTTTAGSGDSTGPSSSGTTGSGSEEEENGLTLNPAVDVFTPVRNTGKENLPVTALTPDVRPASGGEVLGIHEDGIYHTQAPLYVNSEHEEDGFVTVRLRTTKDDAVQVNILVREYGLPDQSEYGLEKIEPLDKTGRYDYWMITLGPAATKRQYIFRLRTEGSEEWAYYTAEGLTADKPLNSSAASWFILSPGFITPAWSKQAVYYSILPDAFFNGDTENDPVSSRYTSQWSIERYEGADWYGGDLAGIEAKLDYISKELGANVIYTNPTFSTYHNAGYGPIELTTINPIYGSNAEYAELIARVHDRGLKIINDGVWLYTHANSRYLNVNGFYPGEQGALQSETSRYKDLLYWNSWPDDYVAIGFGPKVNYNTDTTRDLIIRRPDSALQYFLRAPYNLDGWRLDVPQYDDNTIGGMPALGIMRQYLKAISEDKLLLSENGPMEEMMGGASDSSWYVLTDVRSFYGDKGYDTMAAQYADPPESEAELMERLCLKVTGVPWQSAASAYVMLSNHDSERIAHGLEGDQSEIERSIAIQMTIFGSPSIYYGDEIGMTHTAHTNRPAMSGFNWDRTEWNMDTFNTYRSFIALRTAYKDVYTNGALMPLTVDNDKQVMSYGRFTADQGAVTVINNAGTAHNVEIAMYRMGVTDGTYVYDWENGRKYQVKNGCITASVGAEGYAMLVYGGQTGDGGYTADHMASYDVGISDLLGYATGTRDALSVSGNGTIGGKLDSFRFVGDTLYGDASVQATVSTDGIGGGLSGVMLRDSAATNAAYFMAGLNKDGLYVSYRDKFGGEAVTQKVTALPGQNVRLRAARVGNVFTAYYAVGSGDWQTLGSVPLFMTNEVLGGAAVSGGNLVSFTNLETVMSSTKLGDSFDAAVPAALWDYAPADGSYTLSSGSLTLKANKSITRMLAKAPALEWSSRAEVGPVTLDAGEEAGLIAWSSEEQQARLMRVKEDGKDYLVFTTVTGGTVIERARVEDQRASASVRFQLQLVGGHLDALYSYDGSSWFYLANGIKYNVNESYNGVYCLSEGTLDASFGSFEYGTALSGGEGCLSVPTMVKDYDLSLRGMPGVSSYSYGEGDWDYTDAGYIQKSKSGHNEMFGHTSFGTATFIDVTVEMRGTGAAGTAFGMSANEDPHHTGYKAMILKDGSVRLYDGGNEVAKSDLGLDYQAEHRLKIYLTASEIRVFVDEVEVIRHAAPVDLATDVAFITEDMQATFKNPNILPIQTPGLQRLRINSFEITASGFRAPDAGLALAGAAGLALGDTFTLEGEILLGSNTAGRTGIGLYGITGLSPFEQGYCVSIGTDRVSLLKDGQEVAASAVSLMAGVGAEIRLQMAGSTLTVSVNGSRVLSAELSGQRAGSLVFAADSCATEFRGWSVS